MVSPAEEKKVLESPVVEKAGSLVSSPSSSSPAVAEPVIDPEAERRLVKKLDWILLPLFTAICECTRRRPLIDARAHQTLTPQSDVCNFIDRTSIGEQNCRHMPSYAA